MSHLASADDLENQSAVEFTQRQIADFDSLKQQVANSTQGPVQASLAASAGILSLPQTHHQIRAAGIHVVWRVTFWESHCRGNRAVAGYDASREDHCHQQR